MPTVPYKKQQGYCLSRSFTASQLQSELDSLGKLNVNTTLIDVQRNYDELEKLIPQHDIVVRLEKQSDKYYNTLTVGNYRYLNLASITEWLSIFNPISYFLSYYSFICSHDFLLAIFHCHDFIVGNFLNGLFEIENNFFLFNKTAYTTKFEAREIKKKK